MMAHECTLDPLDMQTLLNYAKKISKHTQMPKNTQAWVVEPPIPQDSHMRSSILFRQRAILGLTPETGTSFFLYYSSIGYIIILLTFSG
jgi:hypothetical protein